MNGQTDLFGTPVALARPLNTPPLTRPASAAGHLRQAADAAPRDKGEQAAQACIAKAERVAAFDSAGAAACILRELRVAGRMSGEDLVELAKAHGFVPHDDRAFGPVFASLVRRKQIECVGFCMRRRGNGTAGGRMWQIARTS